ncbi:ornithine carbamoyltransferase [Nanoarchaeota archaeon]
MKHLLTLMDWKSEEIKELIDNAIEGKKKPLKTKNAMKDKTLAMLFQKNSTRTRLSFEVGMKQLGGDAIFLDWQKTNITKGELQDEVKCMERYVDIIMARVNKHDTLKQMAKHSSIPIINGLCDKFHPCQALADLITIKEKLGKLYDLKLAYIGDGNNVCNSLIIACTLVGMKISVATPKGYEPLKEAIDFAKNYLELTNDPADAVKDADVIYTDTWVSMGQEKEKEKRIKAFKDFTVDKKLVKKSGKPSLIMHCLPANEGLEITREIMDSENSVIYDQAENRMHAQKAVLLKVLE